MYTVYTIYTVKCVLFTVQQAQCEDWGKRGRTLGFATSTMEPWDLQPQLWNPVVAAEFTLYCTVRFVIKPIKIHFLYFFLYYGILNLYKIYFSY